MSYKIVYFTRTGTSKRVAEKLASKLSCETVVILDDKNWKGIVGFIKGGFYASQNKSVDIKLSKNLELDDEVILVTPLWAGGLAPATRGFLRTVSMEKVHLVVTSNGSQLKEPAGYKSVSNVVKSNHNEDQVIDELVKNILGSREI